MKLISLFDHSGIMIKPWLDNGHYANKYDLLDGYNLKYFHPMGEYDIGFAFPPCTHLAVSGSQHWKKKGIWKLVEGLELVYHSLRIFNECKVKMWMIENPVGRLSTIWRKPNYIFHPHWYKPNNYAKRTCLWTSNNFKMPTRNQFLEEDKIDKKYIWYMGSKRGTLGSVTPVGFANAFYEQFNLQKNIGDFFG